MTGEWAALRQRLTAAFCAGHQGGACELGTRTVNTAVPVVAEWLTEVAEQRGDEALAQMAREAA